MRDKRYNLVEGCVLPLQLPIPPFHPLPLRKDQLAARAAVEVAGSLGMRWLPPQTGQETGVYRG